MSSVTINTTAGFDSSDFWVLDTSQMSNETFAGQTSTSGAVTILGGTETDTYSEFDFTFGALTYRYFGAWTVQATGGVVSGTVSASGSYDHIEIDQGGAVVATEASGAESVNFGSASTGITGLLGNLLGAVSGALFGTPAHSYADLNTAATPNIAALEYGDGVTMHGNVGDDTLTSYAGSDTLFDGGGTDHLAGGAGDDYYFVTNAADVITEAANAGTDTVYSSVSFVLPANVENIVLTGSAALSATGNSLNNTLVDNGAADTLAGGTGDDTYVITNPNTHVVENPGEGTDTVYASVDYTLPANVENLVLTGNAITGVGNTGDNVIVGNANNNSLDGGLGGHDTLIGGLGDDTYYVHNTYTVIVENPNEGNDSVVSDTSFALPANVENLSLTGSANLTAVGNTQDNIIAGNTGSDFLAGGPGDDTYYVHNTYTTILENPNEGTDTVIADASFVLAPNIENLTLTGSANLTAIGNTQANTITANTGSDFLAGGGGTDSFVFPAGFGKDIVTDYHAGDAMTFDHTAFADVATALSHAADDGFGNTVIAVDATHSVTLQGVAKASLSVADFHIV